MRIFNSSKSFDNAVFCLVDDVRNILLKIDENEKNCIREVRLLVNSPLQIVDNEGTHYVDKDGRIREKTDEQSYVVRKNDIEDSFRAICGYSVYSFQNEICRGYITLKGGHRVGICGTAVSEGGKVVSVKDISSINLRIAKQLVGVVERMLPEWVIEDKRSIIIAGPPCSGKTTLLRDVARMLSLQGKRVSVIDERGEISASSQGVAQNDLGNCCDIFNGYPKPVGIMTAMRVMSPEVIVCDEIGDYEEATEIKSGLNCGVRFILTAHCYDLESLFRRPQIKMLLDSGEFGCVALLQGGKQVGSPAKLVLLGKEKDETNGTFACGDTFNGVGSVVL